MNFTEKKKTKYNFLTFCYIYISKSNFIILEVCYDFLLSHSMILLHLNTKNVDALTLIENVNK